MEVDPETSINQIKSKKKKGKKKPFIDKKHSTTFRLIHRSQRDPLIADEKYGEHVLQEINESEIHERSKYGIYYTDEYDYLKHLKLTEEVIELDKVERSVIKIPESAQKLPNVIFETKGVELKVGLLNQGAPTNELLPNVDPDVAAALDGDLIECDEEEFEDDFVLKLNADELNENEINNQPLNDFLDEKSGKSNIMERFGLFRQPKNTEDDDLDNISLNNDDNFVNYEKEEKKSCFTNYSMSSAVIKRPDGLQIIDEHFETFFKQYDDDQLAEIEDGNEIVGGYIDENHERFKKLLDEYKTTKRKFVPEKPSSEIKEIVLKITEEEANKSDSVMDSDSEMDDEEFYTKRKRWDCESIISTYKNNRNHPKVISEKSFKQKKNLKSVLKQLDNDEEMETESICTNLTTTTIRNKNETPEERRQRKAAFRELKRERKVEKKMNKLAFKEQKKILAKQQSGVQIKTRPIS